MIGVRLDLGLCCLLKDKLGGMIIRNGPRCMLIRLVGLNR
jgi:hypothetical protein